jgi:hypothetical protein
MKPTQDFISFLLHATNGMRSAAGLKIRRKAQYMHMTPTRRYTPSRKHRTTAKAIPHSSLGIHTTTSCIGTAKQTQQRTDTRLLGSTAMTCSGVRQTHGLFAFSSNYYYGAEPKLFCASFRPVRKHGSDYKRGLCSTAAAYKALQAPSTQHQCKQISCMTGRLFQSKAKPHSSYVSQKIRFHL